MRSVLRASGSCSGLSALSSRCGLIPSSRPICTCASVSLCSRFTWCHCSSSSDAFFTSGLSLPASQRDSRTRGRGFQIGGRKMPRCLDASRDGVPVLDRLGIKYPRNSRPGLSLSPSTLSFNPGSVAERRGHWPFRPAGVTGRRERSEERGLRREKAAKEGAGDTGHASWLEPRRARGLEPWFAPLLVLLLQP
jgi:hypothetical protein